jgi:hypothetical protein
VGNLAARLFQPLCGADAELRASTFC